MDHTAYLEALKTTSKGSERSFPDEEFLRRRERAARAMDEAGLDALLITNPAEINYLTGYRTFEVSVHAALVFQPDFCFLQVPSIETGPATATALADAISGYRWEAIHTVVEPLCEALQGCRSIGINPWSNGLRPGLLRELEQRLGAERLTDSAGLLDTIRLVKTEAELERLRESARMTEAGLAAATEAISAGVDENTIAAEGARALLAAGSEFMSLQPIVVSGPRSSVIHLNHQQRIVEKGDPVFLEFGAVRHRYTAPMMRTVVAGSPTAEMQRINEACHQLHDALTRTMVPGNRFDDAAAAADEALAPVADKAFFSGVYGYSVGAQFPPSWVEGTGFIARGEERAFRPGMVFHLPLCLRLPGQWGIGMSNTVVVGENGAFPITHNDWKLAERP